MAPRERIRAFLPPTLFLLLISVIGKVSAKKDPLRNRRVEEGPFGDLLKVEESGEADEGGGGILRNHALRHRKSPVQLRDDDDDEEEDEKEVSMKSGLKPFYTWLLLPGSQA